MTVAAAKGEVVRAGMAKEVVAMQSDTVEIETAEVRSEGSMMAAIEGARRQAEKVAAVKVQRRWRERRRRWKLRARLKGWEWRGRWRHKW